MWRPRLLSRPATRTESVPEPDNAGVPGWVTQFRRWGVPAAAILVLGLCAPGERYLADLVGWTDRMSWGLAGLFTLYAGLAAVISTQLPKGARGKSSSIGGAVISLALAMGAQPVAHMFATGYLTAEPRPPLWLVISVSSVPPLVLGHLLHFAAMPPQTPPQPASEQPLSRGRVFLPPVYLKGVTGMPIRYEEIERSKHSPVVYFVQNGDRIKIGTTQCVTERVSNLSLRPEDIRLILHGGRDFEADMHELFKADRIGTTEWFVPSASLLSFIRSRTGQDTTQIPVATVTRLRPRPVPSPVPAAVPPVSRPAVRPPVPVLSLSKGQTSGQSAGQLAPKLNMSVRALELAQAGQDKDTIKDMLRKEFAGPDGTPPKPDSVRKAADRAVDKVSAQP